MLIFVEERALDSDAVLNGEAPNTDELTGRGARAGASFFRARCKLPFVRRAGVTPLGEEVARADVLNEGASFGSACKSGLIGPITGIARAAWICVQVVGPLLSLGCPR